MKRLLLGACLAMMLTSSAALGVYQLGDTVADFTLNDHLGNPVSLYDFYGKVIWIALWTST